MNDEDDLVPLTKPIRLLEMVFCGVLIGLLVDAGSHLTTVSNVAVMYVAFGGFFIITLVDVICQIMGDPITDTPMFIFCLIGCALFLASGGVATDYYLITSNTVEDTKITGTRHYQRASDELIAISVISIVNGIIFFVDAALIFRRRPSVTPADHKDVEKLAVEPTPEVGPAPARSEEEHIPDGIEEIPLKNGSDTPGAKSKERSSQQGTRNTDTLQCTHTHHHDHSKCVKLHGAPLGTTPRTGSKEYPQDAASSAVGMETHEEQFERPPRVRRTFDGPTGRRRKSLRKCCRVLIWRRERTISVFLKVIEAALGCVCFLIFALKFESEHSFLYTVLTVGGIAVSTVLAFVLVINYLIGGHPRRIPYLLAAAIGAITYSAIAAFRYHTSDMPEMQTPILINGAVSLVDAALCIATFINRPTEGEEKPQRPPRRSLQPPVKRSTSPDKDQTKKVEKKPKFLEKARKYFKHRASETPN